MLGEITLTLYEQISLAYDSAIAELQRLATQRRQGAQAKYDRKKCIALRGREPQHHVSGLEKQIHTLKQEKRIMLKGVETTVEFLLKQPAVNVLNLREAVGMDQLESELYLKEEIDEFE